MSRFDDLFDELYDLDRVKKVISHCTNDEMKQSRIAAEFYIH